MPRPNATSARPRPPRPDVYSLGLILARLIEEAPGRELAAIIDRATREDPAERYSTAEALATDVKALRDDFPVSAMERERIYVARKFVRRHRPAVAAACAAVLCLIVGLTATLVANRQANEARREAEMRFDETRAIANSLLFEAFDEVSLVPGSAKARELLAVTGMRYLDALAADADAPLDVRLEAGRGFTRLGLVTGGEGSGMQAKVGDGNKLYGRAGKILAALHAEHPDSAEVRLAYAELLVNQSVLDAVSNGEYERASIRANRARQLLHPLATDDAHAMVTRIRALQAEAESYSWQNEYTKALPLHEQAEHLAISLPSGLGKDFDIRAARAANLRAAAEAYSVLGQQDKALESTAQAIRLNEELLKERPGDPMVTRRLATSNWYHALLLREDHQDAAARRFAEEAVRNARILYERDPADPGSARLYAVLRSLQAQILTDIGQYRQSIAVSDEALAIHKRMASLADNAPGALRNVASAADTMGADAYNGGDFGRACELWREAFGIMSPDRSERRAFRSRQVRAFAEITQ